MAYMMSDMAAGSSAALQMQKNMAAAPYVQQEAAAGAEETQLKLQQDRLKAAYAPQEMAIKLQEDQAILEKNKLSNMLTNTGIKAGEESKQATQAAMNSPEFKAAMQSGDDISAAKILNLAVLGATNDSEAYFKNNAGIELAAQRTAKAKQTELDTHAQEMNRALANIRSIPKEQLGEYVNNLPESVTKSAISAVGNANWNKFTPEQKRDSLLGQINSGVAQVTQQKIEGALKKQETINDAHVKAAKIAGDTRIQVKAMGVAAAKDKTDATKETRIDVQVGKLYAEEERRIDSVNKPSIERLNRDLADLQSKANLERLSGKPDPKTSAEVTRITTELDKLNKKKNDALIEVAKRLPASGTRDRLMHQLDIVDTATSVPEPKPAPKTDVKPAAKPDVTSTKPSAPKFEEGKVYTDAKGNKAKYVNGKWEAQ
jgi:hypothetical protein